LFVRGSSAYTSTT